MTPDTPRETIQAFIAQRLLQLYPMASTKKKAMASFNMNETEYLANFNMALKNMKNRAFQQSLLYCTLGIVGVILGIVKFSADMINYFSIFNFVVALVSSYCGIRLLNLYIQSKKLNT